MPEFGKLNFAALESHAVAEFPKKGQEEKIKCLVIPIKENHLFMSEKGNIYMDIVAFERKEPMKDKDGAIVQTHLVKQSLPKEVRDKMTDEQKRNQPIIGSLTILGGTFTEKQAIPDDSIDTGVDGDDLPF